MRQEKTLKRMVNAVAQDKLAVFEDEFTDVVSTRLLEKIKDRKKEVAKTLFQEGTK